MEHAFVIFYSMFISIYVYFKYYISAYTEKIDNRKNQILLILARPKSGGRHTVKITSAFSPDKLYPSIKCVYVSKFGKLPFPILGTVL